MTTRAPFEATATEKATFLFFLFFFLNCLKRKKLCFLARFEETDVYNGDVNGKFNHTCIPSLDRCCSALLHNFKMK